MEKTREELNVITKEEQDKKRIKTMDKIVKEENKVWDTKQSVRYPDSGTEKGIAELYRLAGLPPPKKFAENVTSDELDTGSEEGDPDSEDVVKKTTGKPMVDPSGKQKETTFSDEYGHQSGEDPMAWVEEVRIRAEQLLPKFDAKVIMDAKNYLSDIEAKKISTTFEASFDFRAGIMIAELFPDFKTPNENGFYLDESLKAKILRKLNSGKVFIRDSHSRAIKDIIGFVKKGRENHGAIEVVAEIEDPAVSKILEKYPEKLGVSIGGTGIGYCTECNKKLIGMVRCTAHPKAPIVVKEFDLKEVSLTDSPAWKSSVIKRYRNGQSK